MTVLGIETSCDETSAAVIRDGALLSNVTATQLIHAAHGGVVPELASRAHLRSIVPVVDESLRMAGVAKEELNAVGAVYGPGLVGSLLVGLTFGKAYALGLGIPFVGVNHMEAHILSNLLGEQKPRFSFVNLTVSGGHTQLVLVRAPSDYVILGETMDDAAGEAFDKVAKMLGIGYPGGPAVDAHATKGNAQFVRFPRPYMEEEPFSFSFSGLKTSVLYFLRSQEFDKTQTSEQFVCNVCASFQAAVVDVLIRKVLLAAEKYHVADIALAGGVASNSELRRRLATEAEKNGLRLFIPKLEYCTDNGAMVAMVAYQRMLEGRTSSLELTAEPNLSLA